MKHFVIVFFAVLLLAGCQDPEARLPKAGTIVEHRETGDRYQITWSGITTYNEGACEINMQCVHLVRTVNTENRVEVAVTLAEYSSNYRSSNP